MVVDRLKRTIGGQCAPAERNRSNGSCLRNDDVRQLKTWLTKLGKHPDPRKHTPHCEPIDDACVLSGLRELGVPTRKIERERLVPEAPASWNNKPSTWLTTPEFDQVMRQYEAAYPEFEFLGATPIDFAKPLGASCVWPRICQFTLARAKARGKTKVGVVFNEDGHTQPGSHWICAYIDIGKGVFYYIDSVGNPMPEEVRELSARLSDESQQLYNRPLTVRVSEVPHQRGDNQCGMYCLVFIITLLTGTASYEELLRRRIPDSAMADMREVLFRKPRPTRRHAQSKPRATRKRRYSKRGGGRWLSGGRGSARRKGTRRGTRGGGGRRRGQPDRRTATAPRQRRGTARQTR
jgi:hypothetical protein